MTTDTPSTKEIEVFLKHSNVKMCNTRNVCNKLTLLEEFNTLSSLGSDANSMFVAIVVDGFEDQVGGPQIWCGPIQGWCVSLGRLAHSDMECDDRHS